MITDDPITETPTTVPDGGIDLHRYPDGTALSAEQVAEWLTPPGRRRPLAPITIRRRFATIAVRWPSGGNLYFAEDVRRVLTEPSQRAAVVR